MKKNDDCSMRSCPTKSTHKSLFYLILSVFVSGTYFYRAWHSSDTVFRFVYMRNTVASTIGPTFMTFLDLFIAVLAAGAALYFVRCLWCQAQCCKK